MSWRGCAPALALGSHGTTYGGNPLACAVAECCFSLINTPEVLQGVEERHRWFCDGLAKINERHGVFSQIRGKGLLIGCELAPAHAGKAKQLTNLAAEAGLLALIAGPDVVRFAPSLIIPAQDVAEGLERLAMAVARLV